MTEQDLNTLSKVMVAFRTLGGSIPEPYTLAGLAGFLTGFSAIMARIPEQDEPTATGGGDVLRRLGWSMILGVPTYERVPGSDEWATVTNTVPIETWHAAVDEAKGQRVPELQPTDGLRERVEEAASVIEREKARCKQWHRPSEPWSPVIAYGNCLSMIRAALAPTQSTPVDWNDDAARARCPECGKVAVAIGLDRSASEYHEELVSEWRCEECGEVFSEDPALAATQPSPWRPIAEAPRDGTRILACPCFSGGGAVYQVRWRVMKRVPSRWESELGAVPLEPTHWMPLPAPPEVTP